MHDGPDEMFADESTVLEASQPKNTAAGIHEWVELRMVMIIELRKVESWPKAALAIAHQL